MLAAGASGLMKEIALVATVVVVLADDSTTLYYILCRVATIEAAF